MLTAFRFLPTQSMAADMGRMNCGGGGLCFGSGSSGSGGTLGDPEEGSEEQPGSPMATDRRASGGSACSPQVGACLNSQRMC